MKISQKRYHPLRVYICYCIGCRVVKAAMVELAVLPVVAAPPSRLVLWKNNNTQSSCLITCSCCCIGSEFRHGSSTMLERLRMKIQNAEVLKEQVYTCSQCQLCFVMYLPWTFFGQISDPSSATSSLWPLPQLSNVRIMSNSVSKGFNHALRTGSSRLCQ